SGLKTARDSPHPTWPPSREFPKEWFPYAGSGQKKVRNFEQYANQKVSGLEVEIITKYST
ncbi:hypothetical protein, partial [Candidatus Halocynthiibacter alkanivorans]|uniref:hypothetical protein n=1 Tax=Candidatus Halocynthiibacter alkanivorans TaxID=2267619 RepID=UPI001F236CFA